MLSYSGGQHQTEGANKRVGCYALFKAGKEVKGTMQRPWVDGLFTEQMVNRGKQWVQGLPSHEARDTGLFVLWWVCSTGGKAYINTII